MNATHDGSLEPVFTARQSEAGRLLFAKPWTFLRGVTRIDDLPETGVPEIAFAGRSNVGKSSLINALVNQKALARTSNTPGRTQELNFFHVNAETDANPALLMVDMPGYGYAEAPKDKVDIWTQLIRDYLRGRASLARVFLLIDSRHGVKPVDESIMALLDESAVSYQAVLTKLDKLKPSDRERIITATATRMRRRPAAFPVVLATSAEKGIGIAELRATIAEIMTTFGS